ncbi:hypothetical protein PHLGIDRAFT_13558 [Phlebiopsis gigantea 11061_1 CR5-6]|uniref:Kinesin-like protein n=1 Tax=Phlebiopsis gigantea (strain 11061_1 CR5-6) TaxID=745531 RepID=A0A0C3PKQ5_PHLG1|nr:hypothetical protein PHLGIDRAFT_13558 [Phlebiopsis gigantea 11061_1 CR5-6]
MPSSRLSTVPPPSIYTFSHIFPPATSQFDFFTKTTLPLVKDVLEGQSGLLFTYGVTNSGKTYTIQGGSEHGSAGILPRTLDVIFNSIDGLHGDGRFRPVRLQGIEHAPPELSSSQSSTASFGFASAGVSLADVLLDVPLDDTDTDTTTLRLDRNHEYTIWLSYAEVYNEKAYDLFASVDDGTPSTTSRSESSAGVPRPTSTFLSVPAGNSHSKPVVLTRKALPVKPCPPSDYDASDGTPGGKYVAGLRQIRVTSAAHAKALLRVGQMHRQVFGTLANSQSSRSHALVTIKVLRVHRGERNDPTSIQTSRLTLVDLAGSERTKHTHTTGERLREAGNINKSLMVLGQCMETMRANQRAVARSLASQGGRVDTRDVKKGLAVVPFRHSKLTEILMDYFVGEGRAVMIVNINPYDTGYDENSHVMKFAALAREVCTTAPTAVSRAIPASLQQQSKKSVAGNGRSTDAVPHRRKVTISIGGRSGRGVKDEEPSDDGDDDEEPINPLVDALFDEIENLRIQLFESEMHCAIIEAETREEVIQEMEERMQQMEKMYNRRLMKQLEQHELKMDAKIDMLHRTGTIGKSAVAPRSSHEQPSEILEDIDEADEVERSIHDQGDSDAESELSDLSPSPSPLAAKGKRQQQQQQQLAASTNGSQLPAPSLRSEDEESDSIPSPSETADEHEEDEIEDWSPDEASQPRQTKKAPQPRNTRAKPAAQRTSRSSSRDQVALLVHQTEGLSIDEGIDSDDSVVVLPQKKTRTSTTAAEGKKKKRQLSKKVLVTEDEIERAAEANDGSRQLRRSVRGGR